MPGNEVGDRIHNFFGQDNLNQGQHQSQVVDGTWSGLNNNLWVGSQRQIGVPLISSNLKSYSVQPSADSERGHGGQSSSVQHGLNLTQSALKSELVRGQSHNQPTLNGYMHGHQALQTRQNESNFLGMDSEYNRHNLTSRGLQVLDSQLGNGPELNKKNSMGLESAESPVNYDFFGGQQQMSSQHSSMLQSLPRHQSGISDMQLLHQQVMFKKLQELQRQQQLHNPPFQQQEARQLSSINQVSSVAKQTVVSHAPSVFNGIPMQDASNYSWQPELMAANTNWQQHGASPVMQGSSSGLMLPPDQGQVRVMGFVPQQDQSLYGVPVSSTRINPSQYSPIQMDKSTMQQIPASSNSFPGNQYPAFPDQVGTQDETMASRQGYQGKNMFVSAAGSSGLNLENLQQMNTQQRSTSMQEFHERQGLVGPSETSQEKTVLQVAPSQNAATLDPEEEKILFGSDDNLWDAFGRSTMGSGCSNMLDSTEILGAVPSLQSGSWSALMQSAVAETSSGNVGLQEGWSGLGVRSSEPLQPSSYVNDGSKQFSAWADSNLQTMSTVNSRPFPSSGETDAGANYPSVLGVQRSGFKPFQEQSEKLQNDSSQRFVQQFSGDGSKWFDRSPVQKPVTEGSHFNGNVARSSDAELHAKGHSVPWNLLESMSSTSGQPYNRLNGWNFIESVSAGGGSTLKDQSNESLLQHNQNTELKSSMRMGQSAGIIMTDSVSSASEHANSAMQHQQVNREDSNLNNEIAMSDSSTMRANQKSSQQFPNSHNLNFWKNVDSSVNPRGSEVQGKYQQHLDKSPQTIESSGHDGPDNMGVERELENSNTREKSSDSFHSNISQRTSTGFKENTWLDGSDSRTLPGGRQKPSGHFGRKPSGTRKFQFHPMGDVDIDTESSSGMKNATHSQAMTQQASRGLTVTVGKILWTMRSQNMLELLHKVDQSKEHSHATNFSSTDRNQSQIPEAEISDGSVDHLQQNQSSASQGFGLQLGPPSQRLSIADNAISSQSSSQASLSSTRVSSDMGRRGHSWLASTASVQSLHTSHETYQGDSRNHISSASGQISNNASQYNIQGNFSAGFQYPRSHHQNQQISGSGGQVAPSQPVKQIGDSSERTQTSQAAQASVPDMSKGTSRGSAQQFPVLEAMPVPQLSVMPGMSQQGAFSKMSHNAWASVSNQQSSSVSKAPPNLFKTHLQPVNNLERTLSRPEKQDDQIAQKGDNGRSGFAAYSAKPQGFAQEDHSAKEQQVLSENDVGEKLMNASQLQGKESAANSIADSTLSNSTTIQRDIEAFGRSLKPNNLRHQNYSLLHQMQAMKSTETDPDNRSVKRFKGPDSGIDGSQVSPVGEQQLSTNHTPLPPGDSKMLSFSSKPGDNPGTNSSSRDMLTVCHNDSQSSTDGNSAVAVRGENSQISPQMAPSWFDQYGTFKNGQMLSVYDARKITAVKTMEQPFIVGKPSDSLDVGHPPQANSVADAGQLGNIQQTSIPMSVRNDYPSSSQFLPSVTSDQSLVHVRPKKRKSATSDLLPWHREVTQGLARLQNISMAEAEWARAANRLLEKVGDETELTEDGPPVLRSKRRLILTTQLMQQLLHPPHAKVLSSDASSHYESVTYFVARSALGDACSTISCSKSDASVHDNGNPLSEKLKTSERIGDQYILKAMEDFADRAKKLEECISRLDKRASILDLRVECQDLEKFSVINRFAKFHGRAQAEGAEASSSTDANAQKFFPQRYVTALPIPRNLPDRRELSVSENERIETREKYNSQPKNKSSITSTSKSSNFGLLLVEVN
ncbi:hypothetical protein CUMW_168000 [Citrus unshiu]|uniref:Uncharacterized protein n=1 Tax=Citrus unshiu TaxID=55188 RepID=A0A2H5PUB3_CITUN|nr:hypothetical protein CUMW_168000 [Citrus unshiu]